MGTGRESVFLLAFLDGTHSVQNLMSAFPKTFYSFIIIFGMFAFLKTIIIAQGYRYNCPQFIISLSDHLHFPLIF